jgi:hypothetical protein
MGLVARYDLRRHQPCFDFYTWLCHVKNLGATEVVLQTRAISKGLGKWDRLDIRKRVASILEPGSAFADLPYRYGDDGEDIGTSLFKEFIEIYQPKFYFQRLRSVMAPKSYGYTVTLRKSTQKPWRNSEEAVWRKFASDVGAVLIEDYSVKPMGLHKRVALYAGAKMNFFVPNGPGHLLYLTDYPYAIVGCNLNEKGFAKTGIEPGCQIPWAGAHQRLVWETPTLDSLQRCLAEMVA